MSTTPPTPEDDPTFDEFPRQVLSELRELRQGVVEIRELRQEVEQFNEKFITYQRATQWVVQLAFTLIASATITVIVTAVLRR